MRTCMLQRIVALVGFSVVMLCASLSTSHAQTDLSREARIQAVLILRLIKFVEWPADSMTRTESLQVCIWGESPTEIALQSLQNQKIRERDIRFKKLTLPLDTRGCHVLYVSNTVRDVSPALLYGSGSNALLTISDMPDFNKRGGIIALVRKDNRIGFEIQLRYAREHGLQIGAPLLELARVVD
ncbi:hypothetical protein B9Z39_14660 [Limnohabitans sp. JirII-29]|nr:hypothetical protein B9Z39_14660 [Limnohabitans sp. JirII-29]